MKRKVERRRVTVLRDDVARVDMEVDEDGDVAVMTMFREGNRWLPAEAAPTTMPARSILAGLLKLEMLHELGLGDIEEVAVYVAQAGADMPRSVARLLDSLLDAWTAAEEPGWRRG